MADKLSENDKLRNQIEFLTNLINNAKDSSTRHVRPHQTYAKKPSTGLTASCSKCPTVKPINVKNPNSHTVSDKYSWHQTKPVYTSKNNNMNAETPFRVDLHRAVNTNKSVTSSHVSKLSQNTPTASDYTYSDSQIGPKSKDTKKIFNSSSSRSNTDSLFPKALPSDQQKLRKANDILHQENTTNIASGHLSLQEKILQTETMLRNLKNDLEKRKLHQSHTCPSLSANKKENLLSMSPYKLKKVAWPSLEQSVKTIQKPLFQSALSGHESSGAKESYTNIKKSKSETNKPAQVVMRSKYSMKKLNKNPPTAQIVGNEQRKPIASKLVLKTRYALKRERRHSNSKSSGVKPTISQKSRNKFVSISKYSLKRTRPSLSSENEARLPSTSFGSFSALQKSNVQYAASVVRSKYKVQKVFRVQQQTQVSLRHTSFKKHQQFSWRGRNSWRDNQNYKYSVYNGPVIRMPFYPRQRPFYNRRDHKAYKGYKYGGRLRSLSSRGLPWKRKYLHHQGSYQNNMNYIKRKMSWLKRNIPFDPKMKVDRRATSPQKGAATVGVADMVMVNGMLYRSRGKSYSQTSRSLGVHGSSKACWAGIRNASANRMKTVSVRGVKFSVDNKGRKLTKLRHQNTSDVSVLTRGENNSGEVKRVDFGGMTYVETQPGTLERLGSTQTRKVASRVLSKTVARVASRHRKLVKRQYCMFYNRFGKCNKGTNCPYIHDPDKVAVCTRFLRGTCKIKDCPFSHKVSKEKMPVCSYFLKGICNKDNCPYRHVNVNKDAEICYDFVRGYCPQGEKCKKKHILVCAEFSKTGKCKNGKKCQLQHRQAKRKKPNGKSHPPEKKSKVTDSESAAEKDKRQNENVQEDVNEIQQDDSHLPFKERRLPAYISLNLKKTTTQTDTSKTTAASSAATATVTATVTASAKIPSKAIRIRPQL